MRLLSRLDRRLVIFLLAGIFISSSLLLAFIEKRERTILLSFEYEKALMLADDITRELREYMLSDNDHTIAKRIVTSHSAGQETKASLFRADGSLSAGSATWGVPAELVRAPRDYSTTYGNRVLFYRPLMKTSDCTTCHHEKGPALGFLLVDVSAERAPVILEKIKNDISLITVITALVGTGTLIFFLRRMVFSPLTKLHTAAERIQAGDLSHRVNIPSGDEFGSLAAAFNNMAESIEDSHTRLETAVQKRTQELERMVGVAKENEGRLREAQHIAKLGNWDLDVRTGRLWWSPETYRIFGIAGDTPITFDTFIALVHPDDRQQVAESIYSSISSNESDWRMDYRIKLPDGDIRHIHEEAKAVHDDNGVTVRRIGTAQDVTEQKRTEHAIFTLIEEVSGKTDEEFFCILVENLARMLNIDYAFVGELTPDMKHVRTIALYAHGHFQDNVTYALADTPCDNVMGKSLCIYADGIQEKFPKDHLLVTMGVTSYIGAPLCTSSGDAIGIMAALDSRPIENSRFATFVFNLFTIRAASELERMRSDRNLKQQQAFTEAIIEGTSSGLLVVDQKGTVLKVNRAGAEILGYSTDSMLEGSITALYPDTRAFLDPSGSMNREVTLHRPDGSEVPIGFASSILPNVPGHGTVIIVLFRDLSEIKKLQMENRKREHFEAISKVVSGVAHEVRNPLFGISSIGQILERELEAPQHRALISAMLKETTRMKNLIEELLLYTRPSRLDIRQIDLGILFVELEHHLKGKRQGIQIRIEPPSQATVSADRDKITQVILNLCQNAIDAARSTVSVKARVNGDRCEIIVSDDGPGITAANKERLFEPFFTTKKGGTGLGLPICRKLVEDHGGTLELNSVEGEGTTATLSVST